MESYVILDMSTDRVRRECGERVQQVDYTQSDPRQWNSHTMEALLDENIERDLEDGFLPVIRDLAVLVMSRGDVERAVRERRTGGEGELRLSWQHRETFKFAPPGDYGSRRDNNATWHSVLDLLESLPGPVCLVAHNGISFDFRILHHQLVKYVNSRYLKRHVCERYYVFDSLLAFWKLECEDEYDPSVSLRHLYQKYLGTRHNKGNSLDDCFDTVQICTFLPRFLRNVDRHSPTLHIHM